MNSTGLRSGFSTAAKAANLPHGAALPPLQEQHLTRLTIMIQVSKYISPRYDNSALTGDQQPCIICGKAIKNEKLATWVHLHNGGASIVTEAEAATLNPAADCGLYPIGPTCAKKIPGVEAYAHAQPTA